MSLSHEGARELWKACDREVSYKSEIVPNVQRSSDCSIVGEQDPTYVICSSSSNLSLGHSKEFVMVRGVL
jgi:hypothetical protein